MKLAIVKFGKGINQDTRTLRITKGFAGGSEHRLTARIGATIALLVAEVADSREQHCESQAIGGGYDFGIAL